MLLKKISILFVSLTCSLHFVAQSVGGLTSGSALYCDSLNSGFISLSAFNGQILHWEFSNDHGLSWKNLANTTSTQSYNKLMKTTSFRAIVRDGSFQSDTSSISTITVYVPGNAGKLSGGGLFCHDAGNGVIQLSNAPGDVSCWQSSLTNGSSWITLSHSLTSLTYTSVTENTVFRVIVKTVSGCPNDTTNTITFNIQPKTIAGVISKSDTLCYGAPGDTLRLNSYLGTIEGWYSSKDNGTNWTFLTDSTSFITYSTVTQAYWYKATVKNGICNSETTVPAIIGLHNANPANAGEDITITRNDKVTLQGKGNGSPQWNNPEYLSDDRSFNPIANPINTSTYVLTLKDVYGCLTNDTMTVKVIIPIPTIITPNGDGINDFFEIEKANDFEQNSLTILNRWGIEVYKAAPYKNNWDGKNQSGHTLPDDVYYFVFDYGNGTEVSSNYILIQH